MTGEITVILTRRGFIVADPGSSTSIYNKSISIAALSTSPLDVHEVEGVQLIHLMLSAVPQPQWKIFVSSTQPLR